MTSKAGLTAGVIITAALACACAAPRRALPPPAPSRAATPAALAASSPALTAGTVAAWISAGGSQRLSLVMGDLSAIEAHSGDADIAALQRDGGHLAQDAASAAALPCPADPADYVIALGKLATAGTDLAMADVSDATSEIDAAIPYLKQVLAALGQGVPS